MQLAGATGQAKGVELVSLRNEGGRLVYEVVRRDGKAMPVRDKGPLFIIYPFDRSEELRSERYYGRSAWQLRRIEVK